MFSYLQNFVLQTIVACEEPAVDGEAHGLALRLEITCEQRR